MLINPRKSFLDTSATKTTSSAVKLTFRAKQDDLLEYLIPTSGINELASGIG
jgi:hypothetical protein